MLTYNPFEKTAVSIYANIEVFSWNKTKISRLGFVAGEKISSVKYKLSQQLQAYLYLYTKALYHLTFDVSYIVILLSLIFLTQVPELLDRRSLVMLVLKRTKVFLIILASRYFASYIIMSQHVFPHPSFPQNYKRNFHSVLATQTCKQLRPVRRRRFKNIFYQLRSSSSYGAFLPTGGSYHNFVKS